MFEKGPGPFWSLEIGGFGYTLWNMSVELTDQAADHVRGYLERNGGEALRLGVRKTGCSGWAYDVSVAEAIAAEDTVYESKGITVAIDPKALPLVRGTSIDFVRVGLNQTFVFRNPNVTDECGCGESFAVAPPEA